MKRLAAIVLALIFILALTACDEIKESGETIAGGTGSYISSSSTGAAKTDLQQSENTETASGIITHIATDKTYELTAEETEQIMGMIENGEWSTEGTADCISDYKLTMNGETYYYHSECGTLNDRLKNRCLMATDAEKESINAALSQYAAFNLPNDSGNLFPLSFSYEEDAAIYKDGDPGVNPHEFANVNSQTIDSPDTALELAENECTVEYDTTNVYYDVKTAVWKVAFSTAGMLGGDQTVYLDSSGITCLVVYGE